MTSKCTNCDVPPSGKIVKGLCPACRIFLHRNGRMRTEDDMIRRPDDPVPFCSNCHQSRIGGHRSLCDACRQYQRINGRPRPRHLWRETCKICGKPKGKGFAKGRCQICYNYRRKFSKDRSEALVKAQAPLGWCDCGQPATIIRDIQEVGGHYCPAMPLCDACACIEDEIPALSVY